MIWGLLYESLREVQLQVHSLARPPLLPTLARTPRICLRPRAEGFRETEMTPLLTLEQVAALLGVSKAWVRDHATRRNPRLPVVRLGGKRAVLRFRPQDVENFITAHLSGQQGGV